jgi:quinolinate synthase
MKRSNISKLQKKISNLRDKKKALLLAHNYQVPEIQEIADFIGDSLQLCIRAQSIEEAKFIVFCGVDFMAETAAILNPEKNVIIPTLTARCPMAAMLSVRVLREAKSNFPDTPVVLYVNTLAEAKAESDVVCTSSNAASIISKINSETILFGPDKNLVYYVSKFNQDKKVIPVPEDGYCYVHRFLGDGDEAMELKKQFPEAELLVHPECEPRFQERADYVLSTGGMYNHSKESRSKIFIIGTEIGLVERLRREIPGKVFLPAKKYAECSAMKRITLENTYRAIRDEKDVVKVPKKIAEKALIPIERMINMSK